ncbi:unnamed protein product [Brassicogethes aeneus]|uniref:DUF4371 domain-containing protein n=1 Tax=Brassicogethes aeneus TaxID=1431903 RepID=A0A9P0AYH5_BRAAE|nr:unnamed protein product [Brassicogethes aeneus]
MCITNLPIILKSVVILREEDDENAGKVKKIIIFPSENAAADITDEGSRGADNLTIDNLPAKQLNAPAEVVFQNIEDNSDFASDDNLPLSRSVNLQKKKKIDGKTGEYITQRILEKLEADGLDVQKCRGQSYDNGSNMAGIYKEV